MVYDWVWAFDESGIGRIRFGNRVGLITDNGKFIGFDQEDIYKEERIRALEVEIKKLVFSDATKNESMNIMEILEKKIPVISTCEELSYPWDCSSELAHKIDEKAKGQNAAFRRMPFQKKIGAGLSAEYFEKLKDEGILRHVGLTEFIQLVASTMGWNKWKHSHMCHCSQLDESNSHSQTRT